MKALILGISACLQFAAAFFALRLTRITGRRASWYLISSAILLMAVRRSITLYAVLTNNDPRPLDMQAEIVAFLTSGLLLIGVILIAPIFRSFRRIEELQESEKRFRTLFETSTEGILIAETKTKKFLYSNPAICRMLGYSESEMKQMGVVDIFSGNAIEYAVSEFEALERKEKTHVTDLRCLTKDGRIIISDMSATIIPVDGKECIVGFFSDVTERKKAEEALKWSWERYRLFIKNFQGIAYEADILTFKPTLFHGKIMDITGHSADEFLNDKITWVGLIHQDDLASVMQERKKLVLTPDYVANSEYRIRRKDGQIRWINDIAVVVRSGTSEATRIQGTIFDITERRELEKKLLQSQKLEAVGLLAGGVAHDFNNILTGIMGYADILADELGMDSSLISEAEEIKGAAIRAADLTSRLLAFSRKQVIQPINIRLNELINDICKLISRLIGSNIEMVFVPGKDIDEIHADPGQVEQVMLNLAVNARDAMPNGGRFTIKTESVVLDDRFCIDHPGSKPGKYVLLTVADTGIGMAQDIIDHIFEPFYTTKGIGSGTGLGLATVYGIIKQHDGLIYVTSETGKGTQFEMYLPAVESEIISKPDEYEDHIEEIGATILLADDEDMVRKTTERFLTNAGYTVLTASDGAEAVRLFEENASSIDLAIIDMIMPELGGIEVIERIRMIEPGINVIVCTGYGGASQPEKLAEKHGFTLVAKPFRFKELLSTVRRALQKDE